jgi:hypothetical protein
MSEFDNAVGDSVNPSGEDEPDLVEAPDVL